jgi:membrane protein YdbS with pleckstrin-like domain
MTKSTAAWSTLKVLLIALVITLAVMFFGNAIFNEILDLGVPTWVFSAVAGLAIFPVVTKWTVYRRRNEKAAIRQGTDS